MPGGSNTCTQDILDSLNVSQATSDNFEHLGKLGGIDGLASCIGLNLKTGLTDSQVAANREKFGENVFPEKPMKSFLTLFVESFNDCVLLILIAAAFVSLVIGAAKPEHPGGELESMVDGFAILAAVLIVAMVGSTNDYQKELQFRGLEKSAGEDDRVNCLRNGEIQRFNPSLLVIGDVVSIKAGDGIPADGVLCEGSAKTNESALTGEPDDLKKDLKKDPFFLSSCEVTDTGTSSDARFVCIGIGANSQWGKIKANLTGDAENTPLQDKLDDMVELIGKFGTGAAIATFIALLAQAASKTDFDQDDAWEHMGEVTLDAFIIAITIIVVAIPEGLPLAVTISLAYSTQQMQTENSLIRQLQACETMGNATNICTDKTGTLTENRMTVVAGFFGGKMYSQSEFPTLKNGMDENLKNVISENCSVNGSVMLQDKDEDGKPLHRAKVIGSATEGALVLMLRDWGIEYSQILKTVFKKESDYQFPFNSAKKRSSALLMNSLNGGVRLLCKGASEVVLRDCSHYTDSSGKAVPLDDAMRAQIGAHIEDMAKEALRTLAICHRDFSSASDLPTDFIENPPDYEHLILDSIVGIIDPLRDDVTEAVSKAQNAGVMVRMVTGDNLTTAQAIARKCGILTGKNTNELSLDTYRKEYANDTAKLEKYLPTVAAIEGPVFRILTPKQADLLLERVQVMARSSPDDKYLMVTRLNGHGLPADEAQWHELHPGKDGSKRDYSKDKDLLLPGYKEEWSANRPNGGQVVGVTGDGTNDAPALKASDVGLAMGITGTQVAKNAADIIILDDKFSSIVRSIEWGRCVYDNIRRFLQFQLTVNVVALTIVFIGSVAGFPPPLNTIMMLWVNLIMDTLGALALGTEKPTPDLLQRKPYLRDAPLVSRPMWRNILFQSAYQLVLLCVLLFVGDSLFSRTDEFNNIEGVDIRSGKVDGEYQACYRWTVVNADSEVLYPPKAGTPLALAGSGYDETNTKCSAFTELCGAEKEKKSGDCFDSYFSEENSGWSLETQDLFVKDCVKCDDHDYTHFTIIFNAFVWCQIFNEFNARSIKDDPNCFRGISQNKMFIFVFLMTTVLQIFIVYVAKSWAKTSGLTFSEFMWSVLFGVGALPLGIIMRYFPVEEDVNSFFGYDMPE